MKQDNLALYPLLFEPLYYEKIWGGRDLSTFRNDLPEGPIGESWDIACHKNGMSIVKNGSLAKTPLDELIKTYPTEILGTAMNPELFPLLIKLINAQEALSVQVHPSNDYALEHEGDLGKTEVWYVVDAKEDAYLYIGLKDNVSKETFVNSLEDGTVLQHLNKVIVKPGDVFFIKSGTIHAIGEGLVIAEIQQNSDTTYRLYDYGRGRPIHVKQALEVTDFVTSTTNSYGLKCRSHGYEKTYLCLCEEFSLELYDIEDSLKEASDPERFYCFTCVKGQGTVTSAQGSCQIQRGDSFLIPATLGDYEITGELSLLKSYVPNIDAVKKEIMNVIM